MVYNYDMIFSARADAYPISANERIEEVKATFALEDMELDEQDIKALQDIELGKTTTEEVRQHILKKIESKNKKY